MADGIVVKQQSLASQVADAVLAIIHDEPLRAGDSLPSTGELAERFKVSRTVVREALADLAGRGLIERSQGRECVVSMPGASQLQELLRFQMQRQTISAESLVEVRQAIEVLSARLAAERITDQGAAELSALIERLDEAKTQQTYYEADIAFHRALAVHGGNTLLLLVLDSFSELIREARPRYFRGHQRRGRSLEVITEEHRRICNAVIGRSPEKAAKAMAEHLDASRRDLEAAGPA